MTKTGILVVGDLCPDIIVAGVPTTGTRLRFGQAEDVVTGTSMVLGSSAGITACAIAAAGGEAQLLAVVGDDSMGEACRQWLTERGVDTRFVRVDATVATGSSVVLVRRDDTCDRQILTHLGAMQRLEAGDVTDAALRLSSHLHVSSFFLHTRARADLHQRMSRARQLGLTVSLDTNDDPQRRWRDGAQAAIAASDVLFVNDGEAIGLAGLGRQAGPEHAVQRLLAAMPKHGSDSRYPAVVHKRGPDGASVHTRAGVTHVNAPATDVVDTVGAGDTLAGTALAALTKGADWPSALALAVAAGTMSTHAAGGVAAQAPLSQTAALAATLLVTIDHDEALEGTS